MKKLICDNCEKNINDFRMDNTLFSITRDIYNNIGEHFHHKLDLCSPECGINLFEKWSARI